MRAQSFRRRRFALRCEWCAAIVLLLTSFASAQNDAAEPAAAPAPPAPIQVAAREPLVVEEGVLLLPLASERSVEDWPRTLTIRTQPGLEIEARVLWLVAAPDHEARHWTVDTRLVRVVDHPSEVPTEASSSRFEPVPYLAAPMPAGYRAELYLGDERIDPQWCDALKASEDANLDALIGGWPDIDRPRPDRPDLESPFEHWRAVLLSRSDRMQEPTLLRFTESEALVARHFTELWDAALGRLRAQDPTVADECIQYLTRLCRIEPGGTRIAGWVATPERAGALVSALLNPDTQGGDLVRDARAWLGDQPPVLLWPVRNDEDEVELAIMNRGTRSLTARLTWDGIERADTPPERPQIVRLRAGQVVMLKLARPVITKPRMIGQAEPTIEPLTVVRVRTDLGDLAAAFVPVRAVARPPGLMISAFNPMLSLAALESGSQRTIGVDRATVVQVRRRQTRWELFIDCRRVRGSSGFVSRVDAGGPSAQTDAMAGLPTGVEAVVIRIDPPESLARMNSARSGESSPPFTLVIPEEGWWSQVAGPTSGQAQVFRRSWGDRWYVRVVIPDSWLPDAVEIESLGLSLTRTHGDGTGAEFFPGRVPSWDLTPDRALLDLSEWDVLPGDPFGW